MPKRSDISSILIIGAGPIIIGQACEFDYSGTQACKALKEEGYRIILINSNPATIMTDPGMADATYIEPITADMVATIIAKERPDAILPTMGGQTALNTALKLHKMGVLKKYNVELIGAKPEAIEKAEDRSLFRSAMDSIGLESARSSTIKSIDDAEDALGLVGLPAIIRPSFTLGGEGGGIAYNKAEYLQIVSNGKTASFTATYSCFSVIKDMEDNFSPDIILAAIFATGFPVAFATRGTVLLPLGFTSSKYTSSSFTANCTFINPTTLSAKASARVCSLIFSRILLGSVCGGSEQAESPEWIPASSICSITPAIKTSSSSHKASTSTSIAFSMNLSINTGLSPDTLTAFCI